VVRIRLYGNARALAGREELELEAAAGEQLGGLLRRMSSKPGPPPAGIASAILINGRNCAFREGLATPSADGDLVEILPIVTGG
jgi:molybdopterin converting factor small subunit